MIAQIFLAAFLGCLMAVAVAYAVVRHYVLALSGKFNVIDPQIGARTEAAMREAFGGDQYSIASGEPGMMSPRVPDMIACCDHCDKTQMCGPMTGTKARAFLESIGWRAGDLACPACKDKTRKSLTGADTSDSDPPRAERRT
jgi:hypothetical protein